MKVLCTLMVVFSVIATNYANDYSLDKFNGLTISGPLPVCFTTLSSEKFKEASETIGKDEKRVDKQSKKDFYLKSNFVIDRLLLSGRILYGDPVTEYVNEIGQYLLQDYPDLQGKVQFFTAKTQYANAFATDQGIIFVNVGLIARMHSEAELAFVLAHELAHIKEKHVISMQVERGRMIKQKGKYRGISLDDNFLNMNSMSQEQESEADEFAYTDFYKNTNYCLDEIDSAFSTLLLSEMPFSNKPFNKSFFETDYYQFPADYTAGKLDTVRLTEIVKIDEQNVNESTHPATVKRKKDLARVKVKEANIGRQKFIRPQDRFEYVKKLCMLESIRQMMIERKYVDAIYNCYALLQDMPDNRFLSVTLASALYIYSRYKLNGEHFDFSSDYSKQSTEIKQLSYLLKRLNREEFSVLAISYLTRVQDKFGTDAHLTAMADHLFYDLFYVHEVKRKEFFSKAELDANIELNDPTVADNDLYFLNAFAGNMESPFVADKLREYQKLKDDDEKRLLELDANGQLYRYQYKERKIERKKNRVEARNGKKLGIDKVLIADPFYYKLQPNSADPVKFIESERKQFRFIDRIEQCAQQSQLDVEIVNSKQLEANDTDKFKSLASLDEWLKERLEHDHDFEIIPYCSNHVQDAVKYFGTDQILWTGVMSEKKDKKLSSVILMSITLTYGITLPLVFAWAAVPEYNTSYFALLYDMKTGAQKMSVQKSMTTTDLSGDFVNALTYDTFYQINETK